MLKALFISVFVVFFTGGVAAGFVAPLSLNLISELGLVVSLIISIAAGGLLSLVERHLLWKRYFNGALRELESEGRFTGGSIIPVSTGFVGGVFCGWFVAVHGLPG